MNEAPHGVGTVRDEWVVMPDGVRLALTLYLPAPGWGPQPVILEALPYRKDDLTCTYRPEYTRLRDEYGYGVARLDLRGTGSSDGIATDEYPASERDDLAHVIAYLAAADYCSGQVGMYGTSYSGFNSLHMAMENVPALGAVIAIYASDDRYNDDVHYMGGIRKWVDLVDYCQYMTPMNALPPVPEVAGDGWRQTWQQRVDTLEPWLLTWLAHPQRDSYWQAGSVCDDYTRVRIPTMLIAGWADGYRNNSLRTVEALASAGVPVRLLAGPWAHASTATSLPGPRIDSVPEMVRWFDQHLRGRDTTRPGEGNVIHFERHATRPEPDLRDHAGRWRYATWPPTNPQHLRVDVPAAPAARVDPTVGLAAWISCAGHLPWGQSADQRRDDAASVCVVDMPVTDDVVILGYPTATISIRSDISRPQVAVRLCDVFPDGTSALICRGIIAPSASAAPVTPGEPTEITVPLEVASYRIPAGHRLRISIAGADWPNTAAPPEPSTMEVLGGHLDIPLATDIDDSIPPLVPSTDDVETGDGVTWRTERDVLTRTTSAVVESGSTFETNYGSATEHYWGRVSVDERTLTQVAEAAVAFELVTPEVTARVDSGLHVLADSDGFDVAIDLVVRDGAEIMASRSWRERLPRLA